MSVWWLRQEPRQLLLLNAFILHYLFFYVFH
jgi:hypothetical protein